MTNRKELIDLVARLTKFESKTRIYFEKDGSIAAIEAFNRYYRDGSMSPLLSFAETARFVLAKREREAA